MLSSIPQPIQGRYVTAPHSDTDGVGTYTGARATSSQAAGAYTGMPSRFGITGSYVDVAAEPAHAGLRRDSGARTAHRAPGTPRPAGLTVTSPIRLPRHA